MEKKEILEKERNYIYSVKISLAMRMEELSRKPKNLTHFLIACALCNVFYGLKNAEALAGIDFTDGEEDIIKGFKSLKNWIESK